MNLAYLERPDLMPKRNGKLPRTINMNQLGDALTAPDGPAVKALFVYNSNPAAVAPDGNKVLAGLAREDLFTVVHDVRHRHRALRRHRTASDDFART